MEELINILEKMQVGQLLAIAAMLWFFYARLNSKIEKISEDLREDVKIQSARSDKLYEMFLSAQRDFDQKFYALDQKFYALLKEQRTPKTDP